MAISPQQLKIYLTSAHRAVIFAIAQLSCLTSLWYGTDVSFCCKTRSQAVARIADFTASHSQLTIWWLTIVT